MKQFDDTTSNIPREQALEEAMQLIQLLGDRLGTVGMLYRHPTCETLAAQRPALVAIYRALQQLKGET